VTTDPTPREAGGDAGVVVGQLVLDDRVLPGRIRIERGWIVAVDVETDAPIDTEHYITPGFVDVHVHGWGGHDAMDGPEALSGMARRLLQHGVTSFLPTAVTAPLDQLRDFADRVRAWIPVAPADGADPLGFNLEGPFLAEARRGAHDAAHLRIPAEVPTAELEPLIDGLRIITIAPELPGSLELIGWLRARGVAISIGHSAASLEIAREGFGAGATSVTHLFNAMSGIDHRAPGVAAAALLDDAVAVELIADGIHVHPALWSMIGRLKPADRWLLVSDAISAAGMGDGPARIGGLAVDVAGQRVTLSGTSTLAGSVLALDTAIRASVAAGATLPAAVAAATRNPLAVIGITDRGRIAAGQRADLVELDREHRVRRVMRAGVWFDGVSD
jgi:N-acetylglucosamine-6-phosphate deacetylase